LDEDVAEQFEDVPRYRPRARSNGSWPRKVAEAKNPPGRPVPNLDCFWWAWQPQQAVGRDSSRDDDTPGPDLQGADDDDDVPADDDDDDDGRCRRSNSNGNWNWNWNWTGLAADWLP